RLLQPRHVHAACAQRLELRHRVVVADDADELHGREMTRRRREECPGPTDHEVRLAEWRFHGIERNGTDDEDGHSLGERDDQVRRTDSGNWVGSGGWGVTATAHGSDGVTPNSPLPTHHRIAITSDPE